MHAWRYNPVRRRVGARANSTPQRSGARAVQQPQRDGMANSKFEVRAIVGERFYRFRHELRVEWAEGEEGEDMRKGATKKYIVWIYCEAINSRIRFRASIRLIISTQIVTESSLFGEARPAY
eukprot:SAG31_NODE_4312_length_3366_cov_245.528926_5_plen_122_part_00